MKFYGMILSDSEPSVATERRNEGGRGEAGRRAGGGLPGRLAGGMETD